MAGIKKALAAGGYDVEKNKARVKVALMSLVKKGTLVQTKGTGASGSFKMSKKAAEPKAKKPTKKVATKTKKPAAATAKKPTAKKSQKKPAMAKKATKSPKKTPAAKKATKPKAKKAAPKKKTWSCSL